MIYSCCKLHSAPTWLVLLGSPSIALFISPAKIFSVVIDMDCSPATTQNTFSHEWTIKSSLFQKPMWSVYCCYRSNLPVDSWRMWLLRYNPNTFPCVHTRRTIYTSGDITSFSFAAVTVASTWYFLIILYCSADWASLSHAWSFHCVWKDPKRGQIRQCCLTASHRSTLHEECRL